MIYLKMIRKHPIVNVAFRISKNDKKIFLVRFMFALGQDTSAHHMIQEIFSELARFWNTQVS